MTGGVVALKTTRVTGYSHIHRVHGQYTQIHTAHVQCLQTTHPCKHLQSKGLPIWKYIYCPAINVFYKKFKY